MPEPKLTPEAERALVENHRRFLAFLERRLGNRATAEELLQSSVMKVLEKGSPAVDEEGTVTWFYRVLRNALVDHARKEGAQARALEREGNEPENPEDPELKSAVCACLKDLLPTLKPEYAQLVRQVDLEEQSVSKVAKEIGITPNNAMVRLHRARQALKKQLQRSCGSCAVHACLDCHCQKQ